MSVPSMIVSLSYSYMKFGIAFAARYDGLWITTSLLIDLAYLSSSIPTKKSAWIEGITKTTSVEFWILHLTSSGSCGRMFSGFWNVGLKLKTILGYPVPVFDDDSSG